MPEKTSLFLPASCMEMTRHNGQCRHRDCYNKAMKAVGIIAEYNPFHDGHIWHLKQARELAQEDVLVVIVSSWYSSRGLPSLMSPYDKTKLALKQGADLVLELPWVYACQSADYFALYAMEALKACNVSALCFGSERNDPAFLKNLANQMELYQDHSIDPSTSLARSFGKQFDLQPNDLLGLQYVRWAKEFGMECFLIQREDHFKSATQTRKDFFEGSTREKFQEVFQMRQSWEYYYPYLRLVLMMSDPNHLRSLFMMEEGLEHRLKASAIRYEKWEDFLQGCISKTYSRARIQRCCLFVLMQVRKEQMEAHSSFFDLIVLGMNEKGKTWLKSLPKGTAIYNRQRDLPPFLKEVSTKARQLYHIFSPDLPPQHFPVFYKEEKSVQETSVEEEKIIEL